MKKADVAYLSRRVLDNAKPAFETLPDNDETAIAFAECVAILCGNAAAKMIRESTPESRAKFVADWMRYGKKARARKERDRKAARPSKSPAPVANRNQKKDATGKASRTATAPAARKTDKPARRLRAKREGVRG